MLTQEQIQHIKKTAVESYPEEIVFLLTNKGLYQVENIAVDKKNTFEISNSDMNKAQKSGLLCVIHSHPDYPACPSAADMKAQIASGVPWGIVATDGISSTDIQFFGDDIEKTELVGRSFIHGIQDCYALIRDYYSEVLNIDLKEYPRSWDWWHNDQNLYLDNVKNESFVLVDNFKSGDMILMQIRSNVPNHAAIYLENGLILHHLTSKYPVDETRISKKEPVERWRNYITHVYRHKKMFDK